jgi:hypothetical protein
MPVATAYVCRLRTDVPAAAIQWLDLKPNTSQRNLVYEKTPQTGYLLGRPQNDTVAALVANATVADYQGLAAYLLDNVIDLVSGVTITVTVANAAAAAFIAQMDAGSALDANAALVTTGGAGAGTTLDAGGSTGSLRDVLKILSGGVYNLPSGSVVGGLAAGAALGSFDDDGYRQLYVSGHLNASCAEGDLAAFADANFTYSGTAGAALLVYAADGTLLT